MDNPWNDLTWPIFFKTYNSVFHITLSRNVSALREVTMASNFHIFSYKTKDSLHIKLEGDFDGNSAYELLETLKKYSSSFYQIFIDTNDLKTIYPFGKQVFQKKLGTYKKQISNFIFIGENEHKITFN